MCNFSFLVCTYVKTKNREVEPTRRQAAVHTGMKALGFSESAPLLGILFAPHSSVSHTNQRHTAHRHRRSARLFVNILGQIHVSSTSERRKTKIIVKREGKNRKRKRLNSSLLTPASRPVCPGRQRRTDAASGLSQRWSFYS